MKKFLLLVLFATFPNLVFADIAGPVLTKSQACQVSDGKSTSRLQIFLNGKKSDVLYFNKKNQKLFYIVPMFPYSLSDGYGGTQTYYAGLFLYSYDCNNQKPTRISNNLKRYVRSTSGSISEETKIDIQSLREMSYGVVNTITSDTVSLMLGIPQTGIGSNSIIIPYK